MFVKANKKVIADSERKKKAGKKLKFTPSEKFIQITEVMSRVLELFDTVKIKPKFGRNTYTMK